MGLLAEIQQEQEGKRAGGNECRMCQLCAPASSPLGAQDAVELAEAVATRGIFGSTLIAVLKARGEAVTLAQVENHRRAHVPGWARS